MLTLKAVEWLRQGCDVHLVSVCHEGRAVSRLMQEQAQQMLGAAQGCGTPTLHSFDFSWDASGAQRQRAVSTLKNAQSDSGLYVIVDEVKVG